MPSRRPLTLLVVAVSAAGLLAAAPLSPAAADTSPLPASFSAYLQADRSGEQWSLAATHAAAAWTKATGSGQIVAVIDSGADATSPELAGQLVAGAHLADDGVTVVAGSAPDEIGHGTHVTGIIVAKKDGHGITGIAPGAKVMPINVNVPFLTGAGVGNAIKWAVAHHADVINLSLVFDDMTLFSADVTPICNAAAYAESHGVVVVASAGNDGQGDNFPEAPAACGTVLSVTAVDSTMHVTSYSSFDGTVSLAAPGDNIYSTVPTYDSSTGYELMSGTSMASPFVAGVAALVLQQHPTWTPAQVRSRLETTAEDIGPAGFDPRDGYGEVDPAAAVGASAPEPAAAPSITSNAFGFGDHYDSNGNLIIDETLVNWTPDPTAVVTGYTITTFTATGTALTTLPKTAVRWETPTTTGGFVVTAQTTTGPITAPPVWSSLSEQTPPSTFQVKPLQKLKAAFNAKGSVIISWVNPPANAGHADGVFISLDGEMVASHEGPMPTQLAVAAAHVPTGDLTIDVFVQSSVDGTVAASHAKLGAHVPFSASGSRVGTTRYRITVQLAPSWGTRVCHQIHCNGARLRVAINGVAYSDYLDENGQAFFTVLSKPKVSALSVKLTTYNVRYQGLDMLHLRVPLSPLKPT
jgi:Subtilase family